jgi:hypothetical protein
MLLLFAAAFVTIVLFSRHSQSYGAPLGFHSSASPQNAAFLQPVAFALIMFSEASAKEGAILLKVRF